MKVTVCCGIVSLTPFKREVLDFEYNGFQNWMTFGIDKGIYSSYKAAKGWQFKKIKYKEYPLVLWSKLTKIDYKPNSVAPYWIRIRTKLKRGGIWVGFKTKQEMPKNGKLLDSFLTKNNKGNYELRLIFDIFTKQIHTLNILAVDIGDKRLATVCDSLGNKRFLGTEIRKIRTHYLWLRRRLGNKKLLKKLKSVGNKEKRVINQLLHRISKEIVTMALKNKCCIVLGELKGIRKKSYKKLNRIIFKIPYYKLISYIKYKAEKLGIQVYKINESMTSKTCHKCGSTKTKRPSQSLFKCSSCNIEYNADLNSAINIMNRFKDYTSSNRASAYALNSFT
ncbi:MAG: transposase [Nanoarchaeota archaeon]|nr:transposase [Nanoarchaeota archaeon]MCG2717807.1 RNA-guided endonuclease TnpB family protein [Nanoarchaeota archaeon]